MAVYTNIHPATVKYSNFEARALEIVNYLVGLNIGFTLAYTYTYGGSNAFTKIYFLKWKDYTDHYICIGNYYSSSNTYYYLYIGTNTSLSATSIQGQQQINYNSSNTDAPIFKTLVIVPDSANTDVVMVGFSSNFFNLLTWDRGYFFMDKGVKPDGSTFMYSVFSQYLTGSTPNAVSSVYAGNVQKVLHNATGGMASVASTSKVFLQPLMFKAYDNNSNTDFEFTKNLFNLIGYNIISNTFYTIDGEKYFILTSNIALKF